MQGGCHKQGRSQPTADLPAHLRRGYDWHPPPDALLRESMDISPPFGYKEIIPLLKTHKVRLLNPGEVPPFVRALNAIPISYSEFARVTLDYPIVFTSGDKGQTFAPVAVLGMTGGENLFVNQGAWAEKTYVPAYVRRFPFCMARVTLDQVEQKDRLICIEKEFAGDTGAAMFDDQGQPLQQWKDVEKLLSEYETDLERSREMCGILSDYSLLEPFNMQATVAKQAPVQLTGMFRVDEKKIEHLNSSQLRNLVKKGILGRIYAHLISLENFGALLDRKSKIAA